jgi:hypothetical protein
MIRRLGQIRTPPRLIGAHVGTALGTMVGRTVVAAAPRIRSEGCGQPFTIVPGQRYSEADRV